MYSRVCMYQSQVSSYPLLRLDYCGFGPFCSTATKLLLSISLLMVLIIHMYHISMKRQIIRLSNDINNIRMDKRILLKIN